mmetsp:Transcript_27307/g.55795  ORF Transcript_27307/g.55795 Transcript_27307/m.55795 type:complete len:84 (+) Transcript_27307:477-728(+)
MYIALTFFGVTPSNSNTQLKHEKLVDVRGLGSVCVWLPGLGVATGCDNAGDVMSENAKQHNPILILRFPRVMKSTIGSVFLLG